MHARKKERGREVNTDDKRMLHEVGRNEEETVTEDRACFWLKGKKSSRGKREKPGIQSRRDVGKVHVRRGFYVKSAVAIWFSLTGTAGCVRKK